ncbi:MAG TPA: GDYXXLXY domain-containing protein [Caldisericia bacterium]|nr:GDYXXLXY domain-containing protein [Caldisericia bacterium]
MKIPKTLWILLLWLSIIVLFFSFQAWQDRSSRDIWVKPVPVDPRDLLRGEYIILQYDFSVYFAKNLKHNEVQPKRAKTVYAVLREQDSLWIFNYFTFTKPSSEEVFLRGMLRDSVGDTNVIDGAFIIYNLESWFVPEGQGPILEQNLGGSLKAKLRVNPWGWARIVEVSTEELGR